MMESKTIVSIIIPVFNNKKGLERALRAIEKQTYHKKFYEIIVVDNGSEDDPKSVINNLDIIYIEENNFLGSPYSSRNRGLEIAKGEIVVLLDTTCAPVSTWLEEGVKEIQEGSDLVGGDVVFDINENSTVGELYDSMTNIKMRESIEDRKVAKTTNLFIKKVVFDKIGYFPEGLRSGGDVRWTGKAVKSGYKLSFSEGARAYILPRPLIPLINKQWRVSKGQPAIWLENGMFFRNVIKRILLSWLPPNPKYILSRVENKPRFFKSKLFQIYLASYLIRIVMGLGSLFSIVKSLLISSGNHKCVN